MGGGLKKFFYLIIRSLPLESEFKQTAKIRIMPMMISFQSALHPMISRPEVTAVIVITPTRV